LEGYGFAIWLEEERPDMAVQLGDQMRSVQRWRKRGAIALYATADEVMVALDLRLWEIPDELWIDAKAGAQA
jgi:hypothetical protein